MVMSLHKIRNLEDHKLLSGYIAMFLAEFDAAQAAFMESSHPLAALDVRHTDYRAGFSPAQRAWCSAKPV